jgi:glucose/arabinose dehydrogenase
MSPTITIALLSYGVLFLLISPLVNLSLTAAGQTTAGQTEGRVRPRISEDDLPPAINDPNLTMETVATGLNRPTAMTFLGPDDILVLEKDSGTVQRIIDGELQEEPLIEVPVANDNGTNERGLLGMAFARLNETTSYVFLYYTESGDGQTGSDAQGVVPAGNRLYRYELVENSDDDDDDSPGKLINPNFY